MIEFTAEEIIHMHEVEKKTYKEIAKMAETTPAAISQKVYLYRHPDKATRPAKGKKPRNRKVHARLEIPELDQQITVVSVENAVGKIGDDKVSAFINYHVEMLKMRQGVNKKNVPELYERFLKYLKYCSEHNIMPNNMNAYFALGVTRSEVSAWRLGRAGTPEHKKFAEDLTQFFESVHEQAPTEGLMNPISAMFWQKSHDNFIEASKLEVTNVDPLGERQTAEQIVAKYEDVELPD